MNPFSMAADLLDPPPNPFREAWDELDDYWLRHRVVCELTGNRRWRFVAVIAFEETVVWDTTADDLLGAYIEGRARAWLDLRDRMEADLATEAEDLDLDLVAQRIDQARRERAADSAEIDPPDPHGATAPA